MVRGWKDILLHPPTDLPWLGYRDYRPAVYTFDAAEGAFGVEPCQDMDPVPWISVDPLRPDLKGGSLGEHKTLSMPKVISSTTAFFEHADLNNILLPNKARVVYKNDSDHQIRLQWDF